MIPIYNVETAEKKVAITFNCAVGNSDIDSILETLDKYNVKATFFLLGSWADDYTDEVQKIYDAGHEIGNQGYSHKDLPTMNYEKIMLDIQKCNEKSETSLVTLPLCSEPLREHTTTKLSPPLKTSAW